MEKLIITDKPMLNAKGLEMYECSECNVLRSKFNNKDGICECGHKVNKGVEMIRIVKINTDEKTMLKLERLMK